jgi:hypothetical protein
MKATSEHRVGIDVINTLHLSSKIRKRQANDLDFDWQIIELPQK